MAEQVLLRLRTGCRCCWRNRAGATEAAAEAIRCVSASPAAKTAIANADALIAAAVGPNVALAWQSDCIVSCALTEEVVAQRPWQTMGMMCNKCHRGSVGCLDKQGYVGMNTAQDALVAAQSAADALMRPHPLGKHPPMPLRYRTKPASVAAQAAAAASLQLPSKLA